MHDTFDNGMNSANQDAASQWEARGTAALGAGNHVDARRCFVKSLNLFHTASVEALLASIGPDTAAAPEATASLNSDTGSTPRSRAGSRVHEPAHAPTPATRDTTPPRRAASPGGGARPHHHPNGNGSGSQGGGGGSSSVDSSSSTASPAAASEANQQAAEQWANRGVAAFRANKHAEALRAFDKSLGMFNDPRVARLRANAVAAISAAAAADTPGEGGAGDAPNGSSTAGPSARSSGRGTGGGAAPAHARGDGLRSRVPARAAPPPPPPAPKGTPEQEALVARIMNVNTTYYEVLSVERTAGEDDLKRAYRKLAILCHPDKNPVGNAAFQRVSAAYSTLMDADKRAHYDRYGEEGAGGGMAAASGGGGRQRQHAQYEQDADGGGDGEGAVHWPPPWSGAGAAD